MNPRRPETIEDLVNWFRQTVINTAHGEIGIHVHKGDGQIVQTRKILNETNRPGGSSRAADAGTRSY